MMRNRRSSAVPLALLIAVAPAVAGDWHSGATVLCSDCHTMHNSENGLPMRYDQVGTPAAKLLRAEDPAHLCISCHDGSRPEAPDVIAPLTYLSDPAGGFFPQSWIGTINPNGHDLLTTSPLTAPGSGDAMVLSCVSCHNPHGTANYRNLEPDTAGGGSAAPVTVAVNQTVRADGTNPASVYAPSNLKYKSGMAAWCNDCHTNFHGKTASEEGAAEPWLRHPQTQQISGAYGADYAWWATALTNRVPVETPADDTVPSADDRVMCLSCHKAHGSANKGALIYADGTSRMSTCQQCHNS